MKLDKKHWSKSFKSNMPKMIGLCHRYINNTQLAEDLAQEAFITAWEKADSYKGTGNFDAWLRQITINTALQFLRKKNIMLLFDDVKTHEKDNAAIENCDQEHCIINNADFSEKELFEAISSLPEHHKTVFNLFVIDGYGHAQIARELGISAGTSKSHLARARKKLQSILLSKAEEKQREKGWKRALMLLIFPAKTGNVDQLYKKQFINFNIKPSNIIIKNITNYTANPALVKTSSLVIKIAIAAPALLFTAYYAINNSATNEEKIIIPNIIQTDTSIVLENKPSSTQKSIAPQQKDSLPIKKTPVIVKKKRINRNPVVVKKPVIIIDSSYVE